MSLRKAKLLLVVNTLLLIIIGFVAARVYLNDGSLFNRQTDQTGQPAVVTDGDGGLFNGGEQTGAEPEQTGAITAFQELTIPYLRERSYQSSLGQLQQVSQNSNYTSYVTSYDSDGLQINGLLTRPTGQPPAGGWPAIVFVHGYIPPSQYQTTDGYEDYVGYLARNGFVVFKIDLRGHGNSEGEPGGAYYSGDYVIDTLNARAALQASNFVNQDKVGLWGHSMAGNVVFRSFVAQQDVPAVVIWAGAVYTYEDMRQFGIDDNSYRPPSRDSERRRERGQLRETYGDFNPNSAFWQQVVPTNYLTGVNGAVQLNHAVNDNVVSIEYSRNLAKILDGAGIEHQLNEIPSGGHNIAGGGFAQAMQATVEWFEGM